MGKQNAYFLSMLGIVIGVGAVIAIVSVGTGSTQQVTTRIAGLGSNMITVYSRSSRGQAGRASTSSQEEFTLELGDYMEEFCPSVRKVIPTKQIGGTLISDDVNVSANTIGTISDYAQVNNYEVAGGVFLGQDDVVERRQVMVLGAQLATDLFEDRNPIGQKIK